MNQSYEEEFEEVESPYAPKSASRSITKDRLRSRKNVFNRPFSAAPSSAPLIIDSPPSRRPYTSSELLHKDKPQSDLSETEIDYLVEDEEEFKKPVVRSTPKKNTKTKKNLLPKLAWAIIGVLILRLIFMDRGIWDYFSTEGTIKDKRMELQFIRKENLGLKTEISRIQLDRNYQRQLAKEHLGVIAADEFLILFAGEVPTQEKAQTSL